MAKYLKASKECEIICKQCVAKNEEEQISKSLQQTKVSDAGAGDDNHTTDAAELHECSSCKKNLAAPLFNKNQLRNKGPGKQRCIQCVASAVSAENAALEKKKDDEMDKLRAETRAAGKGGGKSLAAACREAAGEGERVTGLKPIVLGRGGRGKWRRGGGRTTPGAGRGRGVGK
ncbi:hypothetical protein TL16_g03323 [Triparma laevis f. inornata]|uniref:Stc1 domain-containing protein n=2 Tax=Triparma laevis TaxID=1534972 RepID=A0A9W7FS76_9STRA|nr:hypothetical protein TL16_g03323 [Triparma laevis f. inornata]GMI17116.1 hypothetical protein TrLO_g13521 [Triparma laevis f. longispina]